MSAKDKVHQHVVNALRKDGWTITHDPFYVPWKKRRGQIDRGAERMLAAAKGTDKIAVEVKSFIGPNDLEDLYHALGQFILYRKALRAAFPDHVLYLALSEEVYLQTFADEEGASLRGEEKVKLLVFDPQTEDIVRWKH